MTLVRPRVPRWLLLLFAGLALVTIAVIPRGVVRAMAMAELGTEIPVVGHDVTPSGDAEVSFDTPSSEAPPILPGVRPVILREEQVPVIGHLPLAVHSDPIVQVAPDADSHAIEDDAPVVPQPPPTTPSPSRAPPVTI